MQLLEVINDFQLMVDNGILFDCIHIDFSKAFEKIPIFGAMLFAN